MKTTESVKRPSGTRLEVKNLWRGMSNIQTRRDVQATFGRQQQAGKEQYHEAFYPVHECKAKFRTISLAQSTQSAGTVVVTTPIKKMFALGRVEVEVSIPQSIDAIVANEIWSDWHAITHWTCQGVVRTTQKKVDSFIERAKRLDREGNTDAALDLLYDNIDEMLKASKFQEVDNLLRNERVSTCSIHILLGLLTSTLPARSKIKSRAAFFTAAEDILKGRGEWAADLLIGLDG